MLERALRRETYRWEFLNLDTLIRFQHGFKAYSKKMTHARISLKQSILLAFCYAFFTITFIGIKWLLC